MEYFEHRDLSNFIGTPLPEIEVQSIVTQLLEGLVILHENKFTHRDLKPQVSHHTCNLYLAIKRVVNCRTECVCRRSITQLVGQDW